MLKRKLFFLFLVVSLFVVLLAPVKSVLAHSATVNYSYLLGTGALCELEETACPDISIAPNGDKIEITGSGTLSIHPKSVTGGGTFVHKAPDGSIRGSGTWTATRLLAFHSYGNGVPQGLPANFEGGLALIKVHVLPASGGEGFDGILWVHCLLGKPPAGAHEGVRLEVFGIINFNKEVSGDTLFIRE